ncbi:metallo-beta-lactamase family protein [Rubritalea squalenifaciens DSM 18772]|uniref:Metallo-beta-lactamase family protein n=1 Tax=Rubritalea squalenifaciens DSM 18772 TaxID=1123071 RepID=A0A1M6HMV5_9BACT|nr:MBL fold metallo-hydrolase [Rubritalea squalenifaciens]SHJ23525.1 metallo-beta-lactamase family protein [Rubritalea squalenifaciens DSM 18772]
MKLKFCGAAGTTTGSQHLLEVNGQKILLDCGLYQGRRHDAYEVNLHFPHFNPEDLDVVVLSHAHIDHSGNLPNLCKKGFSGNIFATFATRDLCQIMLADSARIQMSDVEWLNKKRVKRGEEPLEPLYNEQDAEMCMRQFVNIGYHRPIMIAKGVTATFIDAGHILGSAQVVLDIEDEDDGKKKRLLFSGDVGRGNNDILRDPETCEDVDYILMEGTYGGREHALGTQADDRIADILNRAIERGGKIIIPAFAVERTQQLLYVLHQLFVEKKIPELPVFVDSPLAVNATEIFRLHPECFNQEIYDFLFEKRDPFGFEGLTLVRSVTNSKELNRRKDQVIIISASGMCEAGRILHHLKNEIENPKNTVLFVGYCAEQTLGWKIREGWKEVPIFGQNYRVNATVEIMDSFSGHADHSELLDYFHGIKGSKQKVFLVHGEVDRLEAFRDALTAEHQGHVEIGVLGSEVDL